LENFAAYYRKKVFDGKQFEVKDYFINGNLQMTGAFKEEPCKEKNGDFVYYHENGQLKSKGLFVNNEKSGYWEFFHENGNKDTYGVYKKGNKEGSWIRFAENGKEIEKGSFKKGDRVGFWDVHYDNGHKNESGFYKKGEMVGEWKFYFKNGQMSAKEVYKKGELISYDFWDSLGVQKEHPFEPKVEPVPVGGLPVLYSFLGENIVYPSLAIDNDIKGKVYVQFVVEKDGEITEVKVVKGVHRTLDTEALRVVKKMPKWNPGMSHNRLVRVRYTLPINFTIN
jgi:TonB family protein